MIVVYACFSVLRIPVFLKQDSCAWIPTELNTLSWFAFRKSHKKPDLRGFLRLVLQLNLLPSTKEQLNMLHYSIHQLSSEAPWVTFVHGAGGSSSIWYKQVRDFSEKFNVLLIDLRGHGKSQQGTFKKLKRYTFPSISNEILEVLDHLKIKSSHFVGISLGTIIIREIAERFPERVGSIILGGAVMKLNLRAQFLMRLGDSVKSLIPFMLLYRFFACVIMPRKSHREARSLFIREAQKVYDKEFKRWFTLVADINPLLKLFRLKDSGIRTLYIMGAEDHMFLPSISKLVKDHRSSELHVIPACGHVVNVEQPVEFNRTAIQFLNP